MKFKLNTEWVKRMHPEIHSANPKIDETLYYNPAVQYLIANLSQRSVPFKVYNLGAGVKRITTDTDVCPCCKRKLP